jgi:hypothetical protein
METPKNLQVAYVCTEDPQGFWTCEGFDTVEEARSYYNGKPDFGASDALMDMTADDEYVEDVYGNKHLAKDVFITDEGIVPVCDICGDPQLSNSDDWNGETGNHLSCEERASA